MKFEQLNSEQQKSLLSKLSKLKALSECPTGNVNETAAAAAMMTRLMLEYQIELAELGLEEESQGVEELEVFEDTRRAGLPMWQSVLLHGLAEAHHCGCFMSAKVAGIYVRSFRRAVDRRYVLVGATNDIQQCKRIFYYCLQEIERLCATWNPRAGVAAKNDFRLGASRAIVDKVRQELESVIRQERQVHGENSAALIRLDAKLQRVDDYFAANGVRSTTRRYRRPCDNAYQEGYAAGAQVDLQGRSRAALSAGAPGPG